jgi:hypothetical protein
MAETRLVEAEMNNFIRPLVACPLRSAATTLLGALAMGASFSGCVAPPSGPILSRLEPDQPGAASLKRPLSEEEKKRYDEIDKQVLREQTAAMAADTWPRYYPPYYYPSPAVFGGYYSGGYRHGWGVGYGGYYGPYYGPGWW